MRIHQFVEYLELEYPYTIKLKSKGCRDTARYWNMVNDEHGLEFHLIHVYLGNLKNPLERSLETLIAHELIHAWQTEQKLDEIHGKGFIKMARKMSKEFDLPRIYIPDLDTP